MFQAILYVSNTLGDKCYQITDFRQFFLQFYRKFTLPMRFFWIYKWPLAIRGKSSIKTQFLFQSCGGLQWWCIFLNSYPCHKRFLDENLFSESPTNIHIFIGSHHHMPYDSLLITCILTFLLSALVLQMAGKLQHHTNACSSSSIPIQGK